MGTKSFHRFEAKAITDPSIFWSRPPNWWAPPARSSTFLVNRRVVEGRLMLQLADAADVPGLVGVSLEGHFIDHSRSAFLFPFWYPFCHDLRLVLISSDSNGMINLKHHEYSNRGDNDDEYYGQLCIGELCRSIHC